jgi:hypothetical protein
MKERVPMIKLDIDDRIAVARVPRFLEFPPKPRAPLTG